jgi:hypothetical protein
MSVATMAPSSDGHADIIGPLLLESTVAMRVLTSAYPSLLDLRHYLHSICKSKHNLHIVSERNTICI